MYSEKVKDILDDVENKELEIAGGSVVGIVLSTVSSLIKYIAKLTLNKKKYADVQEKVEQILQEADDLKKSSMASIDKDKEVLEVILQSYKIRKEKPQEYEEACVNATYFAIDVVEIAYKTLNLSKQISKVGNKMMFSDFRICELYSEASIKASKENYFINYDGIQNEEEKEKINKKYLEIIEKYEVK